jgi:hypothetical protein
MRISGGLGLRKSHIKGKLIRLLQKLGSGGGLGIENQQQYPPGGVDLGGGGGLLGAAAIGGVGGGFGGGLGALQAGEMIRNQS